MLVNRSSELYADKMLLTELKEYLEVKFAEYNQPEFIKSDPIYFPHLFHRKEDIEIMGFLMATIAWGNRKSIINSGHKLLKIMNESPFEFVLNYRSTEHNFKHRTFNAQDLDFFFESLKNIYENHGGLEKTFKLKENQSGMKQRIMNFRNIFLEIPHEKRVEKHISNPAKGSAAKRINMFLRWMVRNDNNGVDFGIWKSISPTELYLPLDVHTGNISRELGILTRKQNDWQALEEIQETLRMLNPEDPVRYDFALFGIGVNKELSRE